MKHVHDAAGESGMHAMMNHSMHEMMNHGAHEMMKRGAQQATSATMHEMMKHGAACAASQHTASEIAKGVAVVASAHTGASLMSKLSKHPWLLVGLGFTLGFFAHKYRKEIIASVTNLTDKGKDFVLQQRENLEDLVAEAKEVKE